MTVASDLPQAVVFDLGNVLVGWDPYLAYAGRMARDDVDKYFADIDFPAFNHRLDSGRRWAHAREEVLASFPHHADAFDFYLDHFADTLPGPVPGSEDVVRDLRAGGTRVLGLTNWSAETFHHAEPAAPAIGLLDGVLVSGTVGLAKPYPQIFHLLARRFGLDPPRTVFTDDSPRNVDAAAAVGYDAIHFTDAKSLRASLAARGLLPAPH